MTRPPTNTGELIRPTVFILAGNHRQFSDYVRQHTEPSHFVEITDASSVSGYHGVELRRVGTWWEHPLGTSPMMRQLEKEAPRT